MQQLKYADITGKIIGAALEVHKLLGNDYSGQASKIWAKRRKERRCRMMLASSG